MSLSQKTIQQIRKMKTEKIPDRQIAQILGISPNSVSKYKNNILEEQHTDERKKIKKADEINRLKEELQIAEQMQKIKQRLFQIIDLLENIKEPTIEDKSSLCKLYFLGSKLENITDIEILQWIETELNEIIQKAFESMEDEIERDIKEREKREKETQEKYDKQYNMLKRKLSEVINLANTLLTQPITPEEIDEINKKMLPYGKDILDLASPARLTYYLGSYGLSKDKAKIISNWWRKRIFGYT
jgi:predicted transcriptional regulator